MESFVAFGNEVFKCCDLVYARAYYVLAQCIANGTLVFAGLACILRTSPGLPPQALSIDASRNFDWSIECSSPQHHPNVGCLGAHPGSEFVARAPLS